MANSTYNKVGNPVSGVKGFSQTLKRLFYVEKLYNKTGIVLLVIAGIMIAVGTAFVGPVFGVGLILAVAVMPFLYALISKPRFGIIVLIIMAYMLFVLGQFGIDGPVGTIMDCLQILLALGVIIKIKAEKNWSFFKGPITTVVLIWLGYNLLEVANPSATSRMAWVYTVRPVAIVTFSYFVFMYNIRSVKYMKIIFKVWLILTIIGAAYGFKQEYIGFNQHELN